MILLSIDPSITHIGWAVFDQEADPDKPRSLLGHGDIRVLDYEHPLPDRLLDISQKLMTIPFKPDIVVVEKAPRIAYQRNLTTLKHKNAGRHKNAESLIKLHYSTGAILLHYAQQGIKTELIEVFAWKGRQKKETTQKVVEAIYEIKVNDHIADAIMIGNFAIRDFKSKALIARYQQTGN